MKIFIAFGYTQNNQWIRELVFPLVEAFDGDVITGANMHGQRISSGVSDRIRQADGLLAFLTPDQQLASGRFTPPRWVTDELATAIDSGITSVEIRETTIEVSDGVAHDRQRISFNLADKASLLVEIATVLCRWRRNLKPKRFMLLPRDIVQEARPHMSSGDLKCTYKFMDGSRESQEFVTKPFKTGQGLCVDIKNVPSESALVQINLNCPQFSWSSDYESIQLLPIILQKD